MTLTRPSDDIVEAIYAGLGSPVPQKLGVALSGGSDSMAVMAALAHGRGPHGVTLCAATVNHGLRVEAADEAAFAQKTAQSLGVDHETLNWEGWDGRGNVMDRARAARYGLLAQWAQKHEIDAVVLGHTADDQAETVLMRLGRASGVDGLSGMPPRRVSHDMTFLRPALGLRRSALRKFLTGIGVGWIEDPSNENARFDRVRTRALLPELEGSGISVPALAEVADNMRDARAALDWYTFVAAREHARVELGAVAIDLRAFRTLPTEIARRLVIGSLRWIGGSDYPPRRDALGRLLATLKQGGAATTLHGCIAMVAKGEIWIAREPAVVEGQSVPHDEIWDGRWRALGVVPPPQSEIRALGEAGLAQCAGWRESGVPRMVLLSAPALWSNTQILAAPVSGCQGEARFDLVGGAEEFFTSLLSH